MIYVLDFRGADVGGAVVPGRITPLDALPQPQGTEDALRLESTITFLFHGFNVNRKEGRASLVRLANSLPSLAGGAVVAVLWPGDHWSGAVSYSFQGNDADDSAAELARFIDRVVRPDAELSFVSHSLGARVVLETLMRLGDDSYAIRQICLMAAAVDDFGLADPKKYRDAVTAAHRLAVLASRKDNVLKYAYTAGDLLESFIFFWREQSGLALGYHGPKPSGNHRTPSNVHHEQIPGGKDVGHYDYVPGESPPRKQKNKQDAAVNFANQVLQGALAPRYP